MNWKGDQDILSTWRTDSLRITIELSYRGYWFIWDSYQPYLSAAHHNDYNDSVFKAIQDASHIYWL